MIGRIIVGTALMFWGFLPIGSSQAVQPAQLMRSNELDEKKTQLMDQLRSSRTYVFNEFAFSGINLTPEQSAALAKLIDPVRGNFLKKEEVDGLCQQVRGYIHKDVGATDSISCIIANQVLTVKADK